MKIGYKVFSVVNDVLRSYVVNHTGFCTEYKTGTIMSISEETPFFIFDTLEHAIDFKHGTGKLGVIHKVVYEEAKPLEKICDLYIKLSSFYAAKRIHTEHNPHTDYVWYSKVAPEGTVYGKSLYILEKVY